MNIEQIMALADAYAVYFADYRRDAAQLHEARAALEAALATALTEKQDNTAALNVQYHEASMRNLFAHPAPVNQQLLEALKRISATPLGDDIEMHLIARAAIAAAEGKV